MIRKEKTIRNVFKPGIQIFIIGFFVSLTVPLFFLFNQNFLKSLDNSLYDHYLTSRKHSHISSIPVIVDINEESLHKFGQWPWPRYRLALLLEKINLSGASAVGIDIVFSEPDQSSPQNIQEKFFQEIGISLNFSGLPSEFFDYDQILADILKGGPFVLANDLRFHGKISNIPTSVQPLNVVVSRTTYAAPESSYFYTASSFITNVQIINDAVSSSGFINSTPDNDGVTRRAPLLMRVEDKYYPNLALALLMQSKGINQVGLKLQYGGARLRVADTTIPIDTKGNLLINFQGKGRTFQYISAKDILEDKVPANVLKERIVILGTSAPSLKDISNTPFDAYSPSVEIFANIMDNILRKDFLSQPDWTFSVELTIAVIVGILSTILFYWSNPLRSVTVLGAGSITIWQASTWFFHTQGMFFSPVLPLLTLTVNFSLQSLLKFRHEESGKNYFRKAFAQYVPSSVIEQLVESHNSLTFSGKEKEVTILFSDIRGFTSISEKMSSQKVSELLRAYFTPMTKIILYHQGTLDKFIGDALMAFWNAPVSVPQHPVKAVEASLDMISELKRLNQIFERDFSLQLEIGIGLHCGMVTVGNMGSEDLFDYTVIGDNVNLASRIEGLCRHYGLSFLVSDSVKKACLAAGDMPHLLFQEVDIVRVKGKDEPITIFSVMPRDTVEESEKELLIYEEALVRYRKKDFLEAKSLFQTLHDRHHKNKLYSIYLARCNQLSNTEVPKEWDYIFSAN